MRFLILALCLPLMGSAAPSAVVVPSPSAKGRSEAGAPAGARIVVIPSRYRAYLEYECSAHGVPLAIAATLIERESRWRPRAVGHNADGTEDHGLMQLNTAYLKEFSWRYRKGLPYDPFDPFDSMAIGIEHLALLRSRTASWAQALVAYNAGLSRTLRGKAPRASLEYADAILNPSPR